jgi:hypothetical protein
LWWPFRKWRPVEIFQCRESIQDIMIYPHTKFWWYRTMLNIDYDVPYWFLTLKNFYRSLFSKWPPQYCKISTLSDLPIYQIVMISDNVEFLWYILKMATGRNCSMSRINSGHHYLPTYQCPKWCPDIEQFLRIVTISQNINIVRYHHNLICG